MIMGLSELAIFSVRENSLAGYELIMRWISRSGNPSDKDGCRSNPVESILNRRSEYIYNHHFSSLYLLVFLFFLSGYQNIMWSSSYQAVFCRGLLLPESSAAGFPAQ